jgi:hypothetical protein
MTQLEQAGRRTTVLISAAVALVVSLTITMSGMLIIPELTSAPASGGVDQYAESGRAGWDGGAAVPRTPLVEREADWQRYKPTNPTR